jgi:hypothetical protein
MFSHLRYIISLNTDIIEWTSQSLKKLNDLTNYAQQFYNTIQPVSTQTYKIEGLKNFNIDFSVPLYCLVKGNCTSGSGATCLQYTDNLITVPWSPYYSNHGDPYQLCTSVNLVCTKYDLGSIKLTKLYACDNTLSSSNVKITYSQTTYDYIDTYGFNQNGTYYKTIYEITAMPIVYIDQYENIRLDLEPRLVKTTNQTGSINPNVIKTSGSTTKTCDPCNKQSPNQCFSLSPSVFITGLMPQYNKNNTNPGTWKYNDWVPIYDYPCPDLISDISYWIPGTQQVSGNTITNVNTKLIKVGESRKSYERN